jgi:hypothetical protein
MAVNKPGDKAMTGPELKQLRTVLGNAIGRRLSLVDMAKLCGLSPVTLPIPYGNGRTALGPPPGRWRPCFLSSPLPTAMVAIRRSTSSFLDGQRRASADELHVPSTC